MTTYDVRLEGFTPLPRDGGLGPWTQALIYEGATPDAVTTLIDTVALSPVDDDPNFPETRNLTTTNATLLEGWYSVVWADGGAVRSKPTPPVQDTVGQSQGLRPTISDVAALLRARTKVLGGREAGTFNYHTRPTAPEVDELIDEAVDEVVGKIGEPEAGSGLEQRARAAVKLYAACLVELSYFPEQIKTDRSAYNSYFALYKLRVDSLIAEARTGEPGGDPGAGDGAGGTPADAAWFFPDDGGGLVGWQSQW